MTTRKTAPLGWKGILSIGFISASVIYAIAQNWGGGGTTLATTQNGTGTPAPTTKPTNLNLPTKGTTASAASAPTTTSAQAASGSTAQSGQTAQTQTQNTGQYKNGAYKGPAVADYYGTVQVEAVISGGKLANVKFLQYPNEHRTSVFINQQAMPMLTREAVQAQSANVNGVSGATFTSEGFVRSLASALASAKA